MRTNSPLTAALGAGFYRYWHVPSPDATVDVRAARRADLSVIGPGALAVLAAGTWLTGRVGASLLMDERVVAPVESLPWTAQLLTLAGVLGFTLALLWWLTAAPLRARVARGVATGSVVRLPDDPAGAKLSGGCRVSASHDTGDRAGGAGEPRARGAEHSSEMTSRRLREGASGILSTYSKSPDLVGRRSLNLLQAISIPIASTERSCQTESPYALSDSSGLKRTGFPQLVNRETNGGGRDRSSRPMRTRVAAESRCRQDGLVRQGSAESWI